MRLTKKTRWMLLLTLLIVGGLSLLTACRSSQPPPPVTTGRSRILLLPLDSRPVNTQHVELLARLAGYELLTPPNELLDDFTIPSDAPGLFAWLADQLRQVDAAIIATNNLISGGLIASRDYNSYAGAPERLTQLGDLLRQHQDVDITLISVLPRQLPTQFSNPGWDYRQQLVRYGQLTDKVAQALASPSERAELVALTASLPIDILHDYKAVYAANRAIGDSALTWIADGVLDRLVVTLDDASEFGLSNLVQRELQQAASETGGESSVFALTGADETSMLALAHLITQWTGTTPTFQLHYERTSDAELVMRYESATLHAAIAEKIDFVGGTLEETNAQNQLYVHARTGTDQIPSVAEQMRTQHGQGKLNGVLDVALVNQADRSFIHSLLQQAGSSAIDSYAGWNTASNSIGSVVAHLAIRSSVEPRLAEPMGDHSELRQRLAADLEYRFLHLADEASYQASVRGELGSWMKQQGIKDPIPTAKRVLVDDELTRLMQPHLEGWAALLRGRYDCYLSPNGPTSITVAGWHWQVCLPWGRLFEVQVSPQVDIVP